MRKGETQKPCPGCHKPGLRDADSVCYECKKKLEEADVARARQEQDSGYQIYQVPGIERFPNYHIPARFLPDEVRSRMKTISAAMEVLARSIGLPVLGKYFPSNHLFFYPKGYRVEYGSRSSYLLFKPETAQAIDQLDTAIQAALEAAYQIGKQDGSHLLMQLADGDITIGDFNKQVEPSKR